MKKNFLLKIKAGLTILVVVLAFFVVNVEVAKAGSPVIDTAAMAQRLQQQVQKDLQAQIEKVKNNWWNKWGSNLVGTTLRNTLNRIALNAATYVASAGEGQKPTYVVEDFGTYWNNIGDAAAGDLIDQVGKNWGVDLCQPPDANIQAKISLGLVQTLAPTAPNCTLSKLVTNYSSAYEKYAAMQNGDFLKGIQVSFDPTGSELGGAFTLFGRTFETSTQATANEKTKNTITQGWLDVRNIAGNVKGTLGAAKTDLDTTKKLQADSLLKTTGNALVDAANTFLNQLAYEGFQRVMRDISKGKSTSNPLNTTKLASSGFESLIQYGESIVSEKLSSVIKPHFDVRSDYSILSDLAICPDINNPGPTNCVIDDKFSQAISEKVTVGDALAKGYLHGDWLVSDNNKSDSTYTLRSAIILRKYRIVSVGWEQAISTATSKGYRVTLQDLVSCFAGKGVFSVDFDQNNQAWCRGLIDPNWVLKAPLNNCAKQGSGNQIISSLPSQDANGSSTLAISRTTDYCADDQSCIKEKTDGSCEVYGYCNEEKRTWKFGTDSCEPVYNTCQTFTSASDKQTASFLENTLDYSTCGPDNSGCKQYSYNGTYSSSTNLISWDKNYSIYFNNKATACDASNEGCTKLLRGKPGWVVDAVHKVPSVNYVMDSDFSLNNLDDTGTSTTATWHWPITIKSSNTGGTNAIGTIIDDGGKALSIAGPSGSSLTSTNDNNLLPKNLSPISGWSYTLSADVKLDSGDSIWMSLGDNNNQIQTIISHTWTTISVTANNTNNLDFFILGAGPANVEFSVRNLKLSPNNYYAGYSSYATVPIQEKLLPNYLESSCYNSTSGSGDYTLKDHSPDVCGNFARKCNREEVGCELFTSVKDIFSVAAKANFNDYCDASCVGYDTYIAKASYFAGTSADNLIPANTKTCGAESAGCSSFTNLDAVSQGGESVEYYSKVRQCIKPNTASCSDFYSWDNAQLKVMSLEKDKNNAGTPAIIGNDSACSQYIYNLPVDNPGYNPDCREFYSKSGQITYHSISNTISCSDNCHAYRLNEKNIDKTALDNGSCSTISGTWDNSQKVCYVCKNNGAWDAKQSACVYSAVPNEGTTCSAAEVGCREYNGNNGNSLKLVASYDFEAGYNGFSGSNMSQSSESTVKNGHSLRVTSNASVDASGFAKKNSAYVAKFMAKAPGAPVTANMSLENSSSTAAIFNVSDNNPTGSITINNDGQWHLYEVNLQNVNHEVSGEILKIKVDNNLIIDNLIINEVTDRYYLIQGSSQVPDVCFYDMSDKYQGPSYNLGCAAYTDRAGTTNNLHQFSELCQNSAVGCELMIQTNNSSNFYGYNINLNGTDKNASCVSGTPGCIKVNGAQAIYAVFDVNKQCNKADAGCTRFGNLQTIGNSSRWVDTYKKNLPDNYDSATSSPLCKSNEVGCDTWAYGDRSASYFKTPGLNTCVFKNNYWYKSPVKRCDTNTAGASNGKITDNEKVGAVCLTDADCGTKKCITDTNDYPCNVSFLKTMGLGGAGGRVPTPDGSVGLCNTQSATCSEYIDPVSQYVNNLVYNPTADKIDNISNDRWTLAANGSYYQQISIVPNKLYILQVDVSSPIILNNFSTSKDGSGGLVRILGTDNNLGTEVSTATTTNSIIFNSGSNTYLKVYRPDVTTDSANPAASISLKEAIINYQLSSDIDTKSCNGNVNTDTGCVLFNARTQIGSNGVNKNVFDATNTVKGGAPIACDPTNTNCANNANTVIKVSPDRICSRWLSCQTYSEDPITHEKTCYKMGECDQLNNKNECGNFLAMDSTVRDIKNGQNQNATGYALLNDWYIGAMKEVGQNSDVHLDFENNPADLVCRRDVDVSLTNEDLYAKKAEKCTSSPLILTPDDARESTDYPAHGKGYIEVLNYTQVTPKQTYQVYANQDYYVNYLVNTKMAKGTKAKLLITDDATTTPPVVYARFPDTANNGWERRVYKFNISSQITQVNIKIYLTSDTNSTTNNGHVYFDDINIEPVLQTGPKSYVSRDCRLYPSSDSMSCFSANNNVIKNGLQGYCLQYDLITPGVCLMWYPADKISSLGVGNQQNLGYSGKFPLDYCTEANGNFTLVKKVTFAPVWFDGIGNGATLGDGADACYSYNVSTDSWDRSGGDHMNSSEESVHLNTIQQKSIDLCNGNYRRIVFNGNYRPTGNYRPIIAIGERKGAKDSYVEVACVPIEKNLLPFGQTFEKVEDMHACKSVSYVDGFVKYDGTLKKIPYTISGDANQTNIDNNINTMDVYCNATFGVFTGGIWYPGKTDPYTICDRASYGESLCDATNGDYKDELKWCAGDKYTGLNEATNIDGSVRVLDNTTNTLGYLAKTSDMTNSDSVYRIACNKFTQVVDPTGINMAWTDRIGQNSAFPTTTPKFFDTSLFLYGRVNEDVPFGAANLPSNYDLTANGLVLLRNQYSKANGETEIAGRPYGCAGGVGDSCDKIGQCTNDPSIYCIYTASTTLNKASCYGDGACQQLWSSALDRDGALRNLNELFVKSYGDYVYNYSRGTYTSDTLYDLNIMTHCDAARADTNKTICYNYPTIKNEQLKSGSVPLPISGDKTEIKYGGLYQLEFDVYVDPEQQPLKYLNIYWGQDDGTQIITDFDNTVKNDASGKPYYHISLTHYYLRGDKHLEVRAEDNWKKFKCSAMSGTAWANDCKIFKS